MYSFNSKVRYSECNKGKELSMTALVNYLQDCTTFHSESLDLGIEYFEKTGHAWVLSSWQIVIDRMPEFGENIKIGTKPYDFKGFYGMRNFWIENEAGDMLVKANSIWIFMDMINGKPCKAFKEDMDKYGVSEKLEMDYAPRKVPMPKELSACEKFFVHSEMIDTNRHVNNGQYIRIAENLFKEYFLDEDAPVIVQIRAEYKKSAVLGDVICPCIRCDEKGFFVDLRSEEGETFAAIVFEF